MEDSAKLRLQWHDHGNELSRLSREIFGNDDLTDVTLTCRGGTPFYAHKIILAAASTYFKSFFKEVQGKINQHPVIFVKDAEPSEMEYLMQFIYRGEVDIPSEDLERLIEIAKDLGIIGLDAVNTDNGEKKSDRRTLKGTKRKSATSPAASTSKLPKVKREHDDPLGDEDFGDFIDEDDASDDDDGDDTWSPDGHLRGIEGSKNDKAAEDLDDGIDDAAVIDNLILDTPIEVTLSNNDAPLVIMDGHLFRLSRHRGERVTWRCHQRNCRAVAVTAAEFQASAYGAVVDGRTHNHKKNPAKAEKLKVMNRFKAKFYEGEAAEGLSKEERRERLKVYIDNVYAALPPNVRRTMPQIRSITDDFERKRRGKGSGIWLSGVEKQKEEQDTNDGPSLDT